MLLLARKVGEAICIGERENAVWVKVTEIVGKQARIGITAPRHVPIVRTELLESKERETEGS